MVPTLTSKGFLVNIDGIFHFFLFCRAHGRKPGVFVHFWVVTFFMGDTASDLGTLKSWYEDNRKLLRWAGRLDGFSDLIFFLLGLT